MFVPKIAVYYSLNMFNYLGLLIKKPTNEIFALATKSMSNII